MRELEMTLQRVRVHEVAVRAAHDCGHPGRRPRRPSSLRGRAWSPTGGAPEPSGRRNPGRSSTSIGTNGKPDARHAACSGSARRVPPARRRCRVRRGAVRAAGSSVRRPTRPCCRRRAARVGADCRRASQCGRPSRSSRRRCLARRPSSSSVACTRGDAMPPSSIPNSIARRKFSNIGSTKPFATSADQADRAAQRRTRRPRDRDAIATLAPRRTTTRPWPGGRGTTLRRRRGSTGRAGCCATTPRVAPAGTGGPIRRSLAEPPADQRMLLDEVARLATRGVRARRPTRPALRP